MKSNQRKEVEQLNRSNSKEQQQQVKQAQKFINQLNENANSSSVMSHSLLTQNQSRYLINDQVVESPSSSTKTIMLNNRNRYQPNSAKINNNSIQKSIYSNDDQIDDGNNNLECFTQTMYNLTTMQSKSNKRYSNSNSSYRSALVAGTRRQRQTTNASRKILSESLSIINRPLALVVIALALSSSIFITHIQAYQTSLSDNAASDTPSASSSSTSNQLSNSSPSQASSSPSQSLASSVASSALSSLSSAIISAALQDGGKSSSTSGDRSSAESEQASNSPSSLVGSSSSLSSLSAPSSSSQSSSSSSQSGPTSIAASLSSAVASAAAAAAVAAAQNSLSGSDARSLLTGSSSLIGGGSSSHHHNSHHHQLRNPGLNLALKLADAIPEVPYNILHNMKKLDHAAPFYNVGNKVSSYSGKSKESTHGFLSSALHASGGIGGAAEQLGALFRSPIWKRIADGYGEFTSEFRSLFRAPPTTMKGPTSSTSKLLRDISVPALLMLLASTIPSDWRPVRTRRKSLIPSDLAPSAYHLVDPLTASASSELPNYSAAPQLFSSSMAPNSNSMAAFQQQQQIIPQQQQQHISRGLNPLAQMYNQLDQSATSSNQARTNDINLQQQAAAAADSSASTLAWFQQQPGALAQSEPSQMHNYETQLHQIQLHQHPHQQQQTHQSIRRFGDSLPSAGTTAYGSQQQTSASESTKSHLPSIHSDVKPVNSGRSHSNNLSFSSSSAPNSKQSAAGSLFSSLTSSLVNQVGNSKLMNRIMNANTASSSSGSDNLQLVNSYKMNNELKMPSVLHRDYLNDKHRYSLVEDNDNTDSMLRSGLNDQQQLISSTKPFLLTAMTQALGNMIANSPLKSGSSSVSSATNSNGLGVGGGSIISRKMFTLNGNNDNLQNPSLSDKTINHHDTILRRNHQAGAGVMEQRELSKLIPQSWREVVKRTVTSVQEQATTQWRSIEGQLANWVQDKLKTLPGAASATSSSATSSSSSTAAAAAGTGASAAAAPAAPVANIFATVGSTALNILGLGGKTGANGASSTVSPVQAASPSEATATSDESSSTTSVLKNKNDSIVKSKQPIAKGALAGVANMIVNTLANRQITATSQSSSSTKPKTQSGETSTNVSNYPTMTGVQPGVASSSSSLSPSSPTSLVESAPSSISSGTASTVAGMTLLAA